MSESNDRILLKNVLTRYDQLGQLRRQIEESKLAPAAIERLRRESRRKINEIENDLREHASATFLSTLIDKYRLDKFQVVIILALLQKRLTHEVFSLSGRELLRILFDNSFDILNGMAYIEGSSILISSGIVIPESIERAGEDLLDLRFRLSERVYRMILDVFSEQNIPRPDSAGDLGKAYKNNLEYLMDLRKCSLLYRRRATRVFNYDYWDEMGLGVSDSVTRINGLIETLKNRIKGRLSQNPEKHHLFTLRFTESYRLNEEEMVLLVTLLFQELIEGNAYVNAVDLLKLISQNEEDLVRKRKFFSKKNSLIRNSLIILEDTVNGKELTGEIFMPNWVIELMLTGQSEGKDPIDTDARLDFHNYLKGLDSSEEFYDNLGNSDENPGDHKQE